MENNKKWWLVPGAWIKENKNDLRAYQLYLNEDKKLCFRVDPDFDECLINLFEGEYIPHGVPFDCMPEWANEVKFNYNGSFQFFRITNYGEKIIEDETDIWLWFNNCSEEWKGKTFPITEELKSLLRSK